jgi:hypothetical protein
MRIHHAHNRQGRHPILTLNEMSLKDCSLAICEVASRYAHEVGAILCVWKAKMDSVAASPDVHLLGAHMALDLFVSLKTLPKDLPVDALAHFLVATLGDVKATPTAEYALL